MNTKTFIYLFLGLAIFFAVFSIYLSLQPLPNPINTVLIFSDRMELLSRPFFPVFAFLFQACL